MVFLEGIEIHSSFFMSLSVFLKGLEILSSSVFSSSVLVSTAFEWYLSAAGCKSSLHSGLCLAHRKEGVTLWRSYVASSCFPFLYAL